jgi:hypothetical protein
MRYATLVLLSVLAGCASNTNTYTYVDQVQSGQVLDRALYTVVVPAVSVFSKYPGKDVSWERFSRDGAPNDLVLREGYGHSSYAANVKVDDESRNVRNVDELKAYVSRDLKRANPVAVKSQETVLCVRPDVLIDREGDKPAFFMHTLHCVDQKSGRYYELALSLMTRRRDWFPADDLEQGATHFFDSFRVK